MYIHAKFPAGIDSQELYNDVKSYRLNVTDLGNCTYLYGEISPVQLSHIAYISIKYDVIEISIKNPTS